MGDDWLRFYLCNMSRDSNLTPSPVTVGCSRRVGTATCRNVTVPSPSGPPGPFVWMSLQHPISKWGKARLPLDTGRPSPHFLRDPSSPRFPQSSPVARRRLLTRLPLTMAATPVGDDHHARLSWSNLPRFANGKIEGGRSLGEATAPDSIIPSPRSLPLPPLLSIVSATMLL